MGKCRQGMGMHGLAAGEGGACGVRGTRREAGQRVGGSADGADREQIRVSSLRASASGKGGLGADDTTGGCGVRVHGGDERNAHEC